MAYRLPNEGGAPVADNQTNYPLVPTEHYQCRILSFSVLGGSVVLIPGLSFLAACR